jgi:photosystem II stability/assembly factor-like uncharacterized protein
MKHTLLIGVSLLLCVNSTFGQWYQQNSRTTSYLCDITFIDMNTGYAVGRDGTIIHTTDTGENWAAQQSGTTVPLNSVYFIDKDNGWAVEGFNDAISYGAWFWNTQVEPATILHTTNGGLTWDKQTSGVTVLLHDVCFTDKNSGIIVGGHRKKDTNTDTVECVILKTTDAGGHWTTQYSEMNTIINRVCYTGKNVGTAVGTTSFGMGYLQCAIFRTTNGGDDWNKQSIGIAGVLYDVFFVDANYGWAVGTRVDTSAGLILRTTDGGDHWTSQPTVTASVLTGVFFTDANSGTVVGGAPWGGNDVILRTTDGGNTWSSHVFDSETHFSDVCFADAETGWIVGGDGRILHTTNGGVTFIEGGQTDEVPNDFALCQNCPNPFNPSTSIKFELPKSSDVRLSVYDLLGREVSVLVNEKRNAGVHEVKFDGTSLASGVYFYRIIAGDFIQTRKLLLLR